jgi:hypothetical protein
MRDPLVLLLQEYLKSAGRLELQRLGSETGSRPEPSKEDLARLDAGFQKSQRFQNRIQLLCVLLLCAIFLLQAGVLIHGLATRNPLCGAAGGFALILVPVVWRLRRLGIDRFVTALLVRAMDDLSPREATRLVEVVYWGLVLPEGKGLGRGKGKRASLQP